MILKAILILSFAAAGQPRAVRQQISDSPTARATSLLKGQDTVQSLDTATAGDAIQVSVPQLDALASQQTPWWDIGAALAGIAVAVVAILEAVRVFLSWKARRTQAAARVSAVAFPMRRQIKSWLDEMPPAVTQLVRKRAPQHEVDVPNIGWTKQDALTVAVGADIWRYRSARSEIRKAEQRIEQLNERAALASSHVQESVLRATTTFYSAFDSLNVIMGLDLSEQKRTSVDVVSEKYGRMLASGHDYLEMCCQHLESLVDDRLTDFFFPLTAERQAAVMAVVRDNLTGELEFIWREAEKEASALADEGSET